MADRALGCLGVGCPSWWIAVSWAWTFPLKTVPTQPSPDFFSDASAVLHTAIVLRYKRLLKRYVPSVVLWYLHQCS